MHPQKLAFLIINLMGGLAVIGSYVHGFIAHPENRQALWGGVPTGLIPVFTTGMLLAASGYCFLFFYILSLDPAQIRIWGRFGMPLLYVLYLMILLPSALWMPLTHAEIANPTGLTWFLIKFVLWIVGIGAIALLTAMLNFEPQNPGWAYFVSVIGAMLIAFQTLVMDAIIWVRFFRL